MDLKIFEPDARIKAYYDYWTQNREMVAGARVVIPNAEEYLTREDDMDDKAFANYVKRVPFYPAAAETHDGLLGLMLRTPPKIDAPENVRDILETITSQGFTIEDLAEDLDSERLVTNYTGLLTDYPVAPAGLSLATAIDQGFRPFVAMYKAEAILGIELGVIANRQRVVRVRLLEENKTTVRELRLDSGVYSITLHHNVNGTVISDEPIIPTRGGKPIDEIPFTLDSSSRDFMPVDAPLGRICQLNKNHYVASANLATEEYYSTLRIFYTQGLDNEAAKKLPRYSGAQWNLPGLPETTAAKVLAPNDNVITELRETCRAIEQKMSQVGLRIIEGEEASNIAVETERLRNNAKNASLAAIVARGDRSLNDQLKWVAWWLGLEEGSIAYETSTDFGAAPLTSQDLDSRTTWLDKGHISHDVWADIMKEAGALPRTYDAKEDRKLISEDIDTPTRETSQNDDDDPSEA